MALRDELVSAIGFVLRLRTGRRRQRSLGVREATDARILAEQIVAHLERCRFRFVQDPPAAAPSTPSPGSDHGNRRSSSRACGSAAGRRCGPSSD